MDDLVQVAALGLVKAAERFDPERGVTFSSFAVPTILGELKRHFRDHGWSVRPPRGLQKLSLQVRDAEERLTQELGRRPSHRELASKLGATIDEICEALAAARCYVATRLDECADRQHPQSSDIEEVVLRGLFLQQVFQQLPEREQHILYLRYVDDLTQTEIGERVGVSQMHVSRLLRGSLDRLRAAMRVN